MAKQKEHKVEIRNKRASFDFEFLETYDAGIVLVGTEIKSIRAGKASLVDSFCYFVGNELFVKGMNVAKYFWGSWGQHEPLRDRKLLLTRKELRHLEEKRDKLQAEYDDLQEKINSGMSEDEIRSSWRSGIEEYLVIRAKYLLY